MHVWLRSFMRFEWNEDESEAGAHKRGPWRDDARAFFGGPVRIRVDGRNNLYPVLTPADRAGVFGAGRHAL